MKVMALTALNDPASARQAIQTGFHGYVTKQIPLSRLVDSIRAVADGQAVIPHRLAAAVAGVRSMDEQRWDLLSSQLTSRERQVLSLLVEGASSHDIAREMDIRPNTVRTHIQNIMTKLNLDTELRLIRMLKAEMKKDGEPITAPALRKQGFSEPFIKRFLAA